LITSVGFHKKVIDEHVDQPLVQSDCSLIDIVFLQLAGKPRIISDEFVIPEIIPVIQNVSVTAPDFIGRQQNVSGTALSGRVNGKSLQFDIKTKCFSFLLNFAEKGTSGAVMYTTGTGENQQQAMGCFKGSKPGPGSHEGHHCSFSSMG
jgi:hypothetical protein